jgi:ribonuclease P protein component
LIKKKEKVLHKGRILNNRLFKIYYLQDESYKVGFIAKRSTVNPVKRNYIKRRIREFWRSRIQKGNYIFIIKSPIVDTNNTQLIEELEKMVDRII